VGEDTKGETVRVETIPSCCLSLSFPLNSLDLRLTVADSTACSLFLIDLVLPMRLYNLSRLRYRRTCVDPLDPAQQSMCLPEREVSEASWGDIVCSLSYYRVNSPHNLIKSSILISAANKCRNQAEARPMMSTSSSSK
jgi:hypothetical protein